MQKKDQSEIKKQLTDDSGLLTASKILKAVIAHNEILCSDVKSSVLYKADEYEEVLIKLKKVISGKLGKNLTEYEFVTDETRDVILSLADSGFEVESLNNEFLERIRDNILYDGAYAVIAGHFTYEVYDKETEECTPFNFILAAICPIKTRIDGLIFNSTENLIEKKQTLDQILDLPTDGFMYPAFTDRACDVNHVMHYSKSATDVNTSIVEAFLGCEYTMSAERQEITFNAIVAKAAENDLDYDMITKINQGIVKRTALHEAQNEPQELDCTDMADILSDAGLSDEKVDKAKDIYQNVMGTKSFTSPLGKNKVQIKTDKAAITIDYNETESIRTKIIDGRRCLVIDLDSPGISVNGISTQV